MKKKFTLIILTSLFVSYSFGQNIAQVSDADLFKIKEVNHSLTKAGINGYDVYEPLEIYHSQPWPDDQQNFTISEYKNAGDINGDGIHDMYYFAGACADDRTSNIYDVVSKSMIVYGGTDLNNLDKQLIYAEIIPLGDLNGDSYSDAAGINDDNTWQYYLGSATGLVADETIHSSAFPTIYCAFFDLDEDGYDDYITDSEIDEFEIIFGNSSPDVFTAMTYSPTDFHIMYQNKSIVGDIDGTGNKIISFYTPTGMYDYEMYVIACNPSDRSLSLLETKYTTRPSTIDLVDIDGDNFQEIVYTTPYTDPANYSFKTYVLGKNASYPLSLYEDTVRLYDTEINYIGDVNDDALADFNIYDETNSTYHIAFGKTNYLSVGLTKDVSLDFSDMEGVNFNKEVLYDITGDGIDDFGFSVNSSTHFGHRFFLGNATTFSSTDVLYDEDVYSEEKLFQTKNIGDINADGIEDVAFLDINGQFIKFYTTGDLTSEDYQLTSIGTETLRLLEKGDFNGDGHSDIAVLTTDHEVYSNIRVDFYYGGESFDLSIDHTINYTTDLSLNLTGNDGFGVKHLGDINNDNIEDFMLYGDSKIFIYYGGSPLSTTPNHTVTESSHFGARTTAPGDMNGDGIDDFAISGYQNAGVNVYFGKGSSASADAYATPDLFLVSDQSYGYASNDLGMSLTGGDFNGDGLMDIATMPLDFREALGSGDGIEGLYFFFGAEDMDSIPDLVLKIPAEPFAIDIANYISRFAGELTSIPDMNNDHCNELYMSGGWYVYNADNSAYQKMQNGIIMFGGDYLTEDSIPYIQTYSTANYNGGKNSYFFSDAHSAFGDFDGDGTNELLSTHDNRTFLGTSVYQYSIDSLNHTPIAVHLRHGQCEENNETGIVVDTIDVVDPEGNNMHVISFAEGEGYDNDDFIIEGKFLKTNVIFNFEEKSSYNLLLQAEDQGGLTKTMEVSLNILNINEAPEIINNIPDQITREDEPYSFDIVDTLIADPDQGDVLNYSATLTDGSDLPAWLTINTSTGNLSGTPADMDLKSIRVNVEDDEGLSVYDDFTLVVEGYDEITEEEVVVDTTSSESEVTVTVPEEVFTEMGLGDEVTYTASLADGSPLPPYIIFDPETLTFTITISNNKSYKEIMGELDIIVTGVDSEGFTASVGFTLEGEFITGKLDLFLDLRIYPNPVKDKLVVEIPQNSYKDTYVEIYSLTGAKIANYKFNSERVEIDCSSWDASIYILSIVSENNSKAYRIVKQ